MRIAIFLLSTCAWGCGGTAKAPQQPPEPTTNPISPEPAAPPDESTDEAPAADTKPIEPATPTVSLPGFLPTADKVHVLNADHGVPRCLALDLKRNTDDAAKFQLLVKETEFSGTFDLEYDGKALKVTGSIFEIVNGTFSSSACKTDLPIDSATNDTIVSRGRKWFATAEQCETVATSDPQPIAFPLPCASLPPAKTPSEADKKRGFNRFMRKLKFGGTVITIAQKGDGDDRPPVCRKWKVRPSKRGVAEGEVERTVVDHEGTWSYGTSYEYRENTHPVLQSNVVLSGSGYSGTYKDGTKAGGGTGWSETAPLERVDRDTVLLSGAKVFMTMRACRASIQEELKELRWYHEHPHTMMGGTLFGS